MKQSDDRLPAFEWHFGPGNVAALKHGAYSDRVIAPLAAPLVERLVSDFPDLAHPRYSWAIKEWADSEARCALLSFWLGQMNVVDGKGAVRERLLKERRAEARFAAEQRRELGLSPVSHARLERERAEAAHSVVDLVGASERGRRALEARGVLSLAPDGGDAA